MAFAADLDVIRRTLDIDLAMRRFASMRVSQAFEAVEKATESGRDTFLLAAMELLALAGNGHTRLIPNPAIQVANMRLVWSGDGLWHLGRHPKRVVSINAHPVRDIFDRFRLFLAGTSQRQFVIGALPFVWPTALETIGIPNDDGVLYRFEDGTQVWLADFDQVAADQVYPVYETGAAGGQFERFVRADPPGTYLRFTTFATPSDTVLRDRIEPAIAQIDRHQRGPVIIDLRGNPGGDFLRHMAVLDELEAKQLRPAVLVDRFTFSAAIVFAALCRARLGGLLVGEEMGDDPVFFAEGGTLALPESGALVRWSDGFHDWKTGIATPQTPRDIAAEMMACGDLSMDIEAITLPSDLSQDQDPALDAAIAAMNSQ